MKHLIFLAFSIVSIQLCSQAKYELGDLKINSKLSEKEEVRSFYKDVMNAKIISPESSVPRDYIQFENDVRLNIIYISDEEKVPTVTEFEKGLWIKIYVVEFDLISSRIKKSSARIIREEPNKKELYFQAPGGQVFRMVAK